MGKVWVQAVSILHVDVGGTIKQYHPGDCVQVGKHDARQWLANGDCIILNPAAQRTVIPPESGMVAAYKIKSDFGLDTTIGPPALIYHKNVIWNPDLPIRSAMFPIGLSLLDRWELAVPITDYNLLARDIGTEQDRQRTKRITHDLRVPVYDTRLIFARQCLATEQLFEQWQAEKEAGDERLAFLRALYTVKPYILALPSVWKD